MLVAQPPVRETNVPLREGGRVYSTLGGRSAVGFSAGAVRLSRTPDFANPVRGANAVVQSAYYAGVDLGVST